MQMQIRNTDNNPKTRQFSNPWKVAKNRRKKSFGLRVVDEWNRLLDEAKNTDRLRVFKKEIKKLHNLEM
jgi:hypothetical protein